MTILFWGPKKIIFPLITRSGNKTFLICTTILFKMRYVAHLYPFRSTQVFSKALMGYSLLTNSLTLDDLDLSLAIPKYYCYILSLSCKHLELQNMYILRVNILSIHVSGLFNDRSGGHVVFCRFEGQICKIKFGNRQIRNQHVRIILSTLVAKLYPKMPYQL